ncbi:hypothetical protein MPLSOD_50118 [Mesorhizobium sp. SOD10]|nr:hypothetical protein MPLSOD_50118 [Mesorhizobium sp. SOD10]
MDPLAFNQPCRAGWNDIGSFALRAMLLDDHISMAQRHVRHGELHIARQQERITRLRSKSLPTADALTFLRLLEDVHALQRQHLSRLLSKSASPKATPKASAVETRLVHGATELISIPDPIVRLTLELEKKLKARMKWLAAKPPKGRLH